MIKPRLTSNPEIKTKFDSYPPLVKERLLALRSLILDTASEIDGITEIQESLKWGEPSYGVKGGSPIRIDWKAKSPDQYALYFNCQTSLVETFKVLYGESLSYQKNRAILLMVHEDLPLKTLKSCIEMALKYHSIKDKPLLGY